MKYILFGILVIGLQACGTISSYKTAELTEADGVEFSGGLSYSEIPFYDDNNPNVNNELFEDNTKNYLVPDISIWTRLGGKRSSVDAGISMAPIPMGISVYLRQHIFPGNLMIPEATLGLMFRKFTNGLLGLNQGYSASYQDLGVPLYLSWRLFNVTNVATYMNITPLVRIYEYRAGWIDSYQEDFDVSSEGIQFTFGAQLKFLRLEYGVLALSKGHYQHHLGGAFYFKSVWFQ